ncbi:MAG: EamA family transporter [Verrucomicrobiae bacterium]|nr:EamA family transporter [Verrucomicrobiae bacterium]
MTKVLIILVCALVAEATGVVCLSKGLKQVGPPKSFDLREISRVVVAGATNPHVLTGVALEAAFFCALLYLLTHRDVSLIWPLTALGFVITTLAARFFLNEHVSPTRWVGVALIVIGAALVSYSEHAKQAGQGKRAAPTSSTTPQ